MLQPHHLGSERRGTMVSNVVGDLNLEKEVLMIIEVLDYQKIILIDWRRFMGENYTKNLKIPLGNIEFR